MLNLILGIIIGILLSIVAILSKHLDIIFAKVKQRIGKQEATIVSLKNPLDEIDI